VLLFAIVGSLILVSLRYGLTAEQKANDVRLNIGRLHEMVARIEGFRQTEGRLPTQAEINCDWKPCPEFQPFVWRIAPESDGTFSLRYHSLGVMFSPVRSYYVTWYSRDRTTDYDGWDQAWRWRLGSWLMAVLGITVIVFPWVAWPPFRRRKTPALRV